MAGEVTRKNRDLLKQYKALPDIQKTIVQLLAVYKDFCSQTMLVSCLRMSGIGNGETLNTLTVPRLKPHLNAVIDMGLVHKTTKGLKCRDALQLTVVYDTVKSGRIHVLASAVNAHTANPVAYDKWRDYPNYTAALRDLQMTVFAGRAPEDLDEIAVNILDQFPDDYTSDNPFLWLLHNPFDPELIERIEPEMRYSALNYLLTYATQTLLPCREARAYIAAHMEEIPFQHAYGFIHSFLLQGRVDLARRLLLMNRHINGAHALSGWLECISGNTEAALDAFNLHLKKVKKATGKRKVPVGRIPGIFYFFALLKIGGKKQLELALAQIKMAEKASEVHVIQLLLNDAKAVVHEQLGRAASRAGDFKYLLPDLPPFFVFCFSLMQTWRDPKAATVAIPFLKTVRDNAESADFCWLAAETAALLTRLGQASPKNQAKAARLHEKWATASLVDIVKAEAKWEKSLRALIQIREEGGRASATDAQADQRLIWLFHYAESYNYCQLFPRLQKKTKKGTWTKGRAVALKNLYHNHDTMIGLTDQDRRICRTIKESYSYGEYRYYGRSLEYDFNYAKSLPALVDHPLVFLEESPGVKVELVMGEPEIRILRKQGKIELTLTPRPSEHIEGDLAVLRDSPTRFKIVRFKAVHHRISAVVGDGLKMPKAAEAMAKQAIDTLSELVTVHSDLKGGENLTRVTADPIPHAHVMPYQDGIKVEFFIRPLGTDGPSFKPGKGGKNVLAVRKGKKCQAVRDLSREKALAEAVFRACPALARQGEIDEEFIADDPEAALELLLALKECNEPHVMAWPQGEKLAVRKKATFNDLSLKIRKDRDWFKATGAVQIDEKLSVDLRKLLDLLENSLGRFIPLDDGTFLAITTDLKHRLAELNAYSTGHGKGVRFIPFAAPALQELTDSVDDFQGDTAWNTHCRRLRDIPHFDIPSTLQGQLRNYQIDGFHWLARLSHWGVGGCLADDMGLGKTVQAIAAVLRTAAKGPCLVVAPLSVTANWQEECRRFAPTLRVFVFGPGDRQQMVDDLKPFDLLVASYGLLQVEAKMLAAKAWQTVILDEAQAIKNMKTKRSRAAMALSAESKIITTGTPVENHLDELWTLFNFLNPGLLGSFKKFNDRFAIPIERDRDRSTKDRLRKLIHPFILRRLKTDVLRELPAKTEVTLHVEMSPQELSLYEAQRRKALETIAETNDGKGQKHLRILTEIMKLRRLCCNPELLLPDCKIESSKLRVFGDVLGELLANNHKALVFSQFVGHLKIIKNHLDSRGISHQYLDGATPMKKRKQRIDDFQNGRGDVFLISLKAGGTGLNLTAADYVIHMDPWWNPAVEDQASDRAHRIGQQRPVTVYRLVVKDSIEEMIVKLHEEKRDLASSLLAGSDAAGKFSAEELLGLLKNPEASGPGIN